MEEKESNKQRHFEKMHVIKIIFEETMIMVVNICSLALLVCLLFASVKKEVNLFLDVFQNMTLCKFGSVGLYNKTKIIKNNN